jgi:hypothetical protein
MMSSSRRLQTLQAQLGAAGQPPQQHMQHHQEQQQIARAPTAAAVKGLPRFDPYVLETYLDDLRDLKRQVYDLFKFRPELLPGVEEGMSKGEAARFAMRL